MRTMIPVVLIAHAKRVFFQSSGPKCNWVQIDTARGKSIKNGIRQNDLKMRTVMRKSLQNRRKKIGPKKKRPAGHQQTALVSIDFASSLCERQNGHFFGANPHCTAHFKGAIFGSTDLDHLHHLFLNAKLVIFCRAKHHCTEHFKGDVFGSNHLDLLKMTSFDKKVKKALRVYNSYRCAPHPLPPPDTTGRIVLLYIINNNN